MRPLARFATATMAGAAVLTAGAAHASDSEVEAAFQAIQRAVEARDVARLEQLVHPDFEMLHALGQIERRTTWLALVGSGRLPRQTAEIREYEAEIRLFGATAVRGSIVRFRDRRLGRDMWLRGTATFVREGALWRQIRQQSTMLHDGPLADAENLSDFIGDYAIPGRDGFRIEAAGELLAVRWATGARLPLVPIGTDRFGAGPTSTIEFARASSGAVTSATRSGPEGRWWTATRAAAR